MYRFYKYYISSSSLQFQGSRAASIAAAQVSGSGARPAAGLGSRHPAATGDKLESLGQVCSGVWGVGRKGLLGRQGRTHPAVNSDKLEGMGQM